MNIFVFIKRVPDTESKIRINPEAKTVVEEGLNFILNPYDEYALEEALRLREAKGGRVTALTVGREEALVTLRKCLAMGVDEAVLVKDDTPECYDSLRVARMISRVMEKKFPSFDLLLFGKQAVGSDNSQVPSMVAEFLSLPQANVVTRLEVEGARGVAYREIEGAVEKVEFNLPAVISAQKGLNEPRYETLKGIMAAKKKQIPVFSPEELGLSADALLPQLEITKIDVPAARKAGKILDGSPEEAAKQLVGLLRAEAKAI